MCGLFGWNFKRKSRLDIGKREAFAQVLAIANSYRGDKSWGVYSVSKQGPIIRKAVGDICLVSDFGSYGRLPLVMGHTRQPTQGKITEKNAHPFTVGKITLAHNGTISNSTELDKKHNRDCAVDSMHLAHHLNEGKDFKDIQGYGAITWSHADNPERVYLCRLRSGSLHVGGIKNGFGETVGIVWSSDDRHLRSAVGAARMDGFFFEALKEGQIYYTEQGKYFSSDENNKLELSEPHYTTYGSTEYWKKYEENRGYWEESSPGTFKWVQKTTGFQRTARADDEDEMDAMSRLHGYGRGGYFGYGGE